MTRRGRAPAGRNTFEEERSEAIESAQAGIAERPGDHVTRSACAALLRHLARNVPERPSHGSAPAV